MSAVTARLASLLDSTLSGACRTSSSCRRTARSARPPEAGACRALSLRRSRKRSGLAVTEVQRCGDDEAKRVFMGVMAMLAGVTRYGIASGTVKTVTA